VPLRRRRKPTVRRACHEAARPWLGRRGRGLRPTPVPRGAGVRRWPGAQRGAGVRLAGWPRGCAWLSAGRRRRPGVQDRL